MRPLAEYILGLTVEATLAAREQKPGLAYEKREYVLVPGPGGFALQNGATRPCSLLYQWQILTVQVRVTVLWP